MFLKAWADTTISIEGLFVADHVLGRSLALQLAPYLHWARRERQPISCLCVMMSQHSDFLQRIFFFAEDFLHEFTSWLFGLLGFCPDKLQHSPPMAAALTNRSQLCHMALQFSFTPVRKVVRAIFSLWRDSNLGRQVQT